MLFLKCSSLRLDGIQRSGTLEESEFVLPYRASAFQFHKYKILMEVFLPSQNLLQVNETLSVVEKCFLHRMLSSTVQQWERGDENIVCPVTAEQRQGMVTQSSVRYVYVIFTFSVFVIQLILWNIKSTNPNLFSYKIFCYYSFVIYKKNIQYIQIASRVLIFILKLYFTKAFPELIII